MNFIGISAKKCEKLTFYLLNDLRVNFNKFSYTYFVKYWKFQNLSHSKTPASNWGRFEAGFTNCYFDNMFNKMIHILIKIGKCIWYYLKICGFEKKFVSFYIIVTILLYLTLFYYFIKEFE